MNPALRVKAAVSGSVRGLFKGCKLALNCVSLLLFLLISELWKEPPLPHYWPKYTPVQQSFLTHSPRCEEWMTGRQECLWKQWSCRTTEQNLSPLIFSSAVRVSGALRLWWKTPCRKNSSAFLFCLGMTKHIGLSILKNSFVSVLLYFSSYISMHVALNRIVFPYPWFCWLAHSCFFISITPSSFSSKESRLNYGG